MSLTLSIPVHRPVYDIPNFQILRRLGERLRSFAEASSKTTAASSTTAYSLAESIDQCDSLVEELIDELLSSLQSISLDAPTKQLSEIDQSIEEGVENDGYHDLLCQRSELIDEICISMRIAAGGFRTAADELQVSAEKIRELGNCGFDDDDQITGRPCAMAMELERVCEAWRDFASSVDAVDPLMITGPGIGSMVEKQRLYLDRLRDAHYRAGDGE